MERLGFIMRDLLELRDEIDQIDSQIVDLYERRMAISEEVAEYKIAVGKKYLTSSVRFPSWKH